MDFWEWWIYDHILYTLQYVSVQCERFVGFEGKKKPNNSAAV